MTDEPLERHFLRALRRHRLLWPVAIAAALFTGAVAVRFVHWIGWSP